jgi:hypothetical protein
MINMLRSVSFLVFITAITGCSVFGNSGVEIAPYTVLQKEEPYELRHYERLVLVTTPYEDIEEQRNPFMRLFDYISGANDGTKEIAMTAPVFMDRQGNTSETMSFVLPESFSLESAPEPENPAVKLEELKNYTVATVTFNGLLGTENIEEHNELLNQWIAKMELETIGPAKVAGYNPPYTIPWMRRNEVLIPVQMP